MSSTVVPAQRARLQSSDAFVVPLTRSHNQFRIALVNRQLGRYASLSLFSTAMVAPTSAPRYVAFGSSLLA